ncbi:MAG: electron transfer flavoprotein subunit alpha/FixB family protein [Victivallales bacterium]|nr:electron transfer flavoprotein subunit alpha/FixB family protein [Victivallales bacterium]
MKIWIFAEIYRRRLSQVALELISCGRGLAAYAQVTAVLIGHGLDDAVRDAAAAGAAQIIVADHPLLENYDDCRFEAILTNLIRKYNPDILLGGATAIGRALLPRCAVKLHTGLTADCTQLTIEPETGLLLQTRPAFGGNLFATIKTAEYRPQMATVRPQVMKITPFTMVKEPEIIRVTPSEDELRGSFDWLDFIPKAESDSDLRNAKVIVTAGYGCGGPDGVKLVREFAAAIGATLAASRPVVDAGWLPYSCQVGQTGTTVQPDIYVAIGVSGAIQHWVGMSNAKKIIAVNKDPDCFMMQQADIAVQADLFSLLPAAISKLQK